MHVYMLSRFSCVWLFATQLTVACQAPPSMGFPRQEYWSGFPFPSPGELPHPEISYLLSPYLLHCRQILYYWATKKLTYNFFLSCWLKSCSIQYTKPAMWKRRLPFPSPGDLPTPGIKPGSTALQAAALPSEPPGKPKPAIERCNYVKTFSFHDL